MQARPLARTACPEDTCPGRLRRRPRFLAAPTLKCVRPPARLCRRSIGLHCARCHRQAAAAAWLQCAVRWPRLLKPRTRGGRGFDENPPVVKSAGLEKTRPQVDPWVYFFTRTRTRGFRVSAGVTKDVIKMYKFVNLNSPTSHFYK